MKRHNQLPPCLRTAFLQSCGKNWWDMLALRTCLIRFTGRVSEKGFNSPPWSSVSSMAVPYNRRRSSVRYCESGESGLGKSTLINTLFNTTLYPRKEALPPHAERPQTVAIQSISAGKSPLIQFSLLPWAFVPSKILKRMAFVSVLLWWTLLALAISWIMMIG